MREVDVIVIGAGISGCIAATLLARKGYRVVIISRDAGTTHHLPESWIYNPAGSISSLGIEEKILSALRQQSHCTFCSSDSQHSVEVIVKDKAKKIEKGSVVWVERNQLDRMLLNSALDQGVIFQPLSRIINCHVSATEVALSSEAQNERFELKASYIVDASGKTAFLSHHLQLPVEERKLDSRVAYFSHFESQSAMVENMKIVHIDGGYLFCIPISDRRLSIGCVIAENLIQAKASPDEIFASTISSSSYVSCLVAQSTKVLPIIPAKNHQRICLEPSGPRYRLIGDAAAFLDPFFCPGIDFAFFSAEQAVETIEKNTAQNYKTAVREWLENSRFGVYEKIQRSDWKGIVRLFADPHLPFVVPLMFTQAFCQSKEKNLSFKNGIQLAREAYEMASH
ncbi:MAG: NAD(P)/FAD-dependent oxidoreductase [Chlamydiae bacterium]|nr:NAD(P)/FAD-dependent oxidoreductase [Chlamydiota bacterium]